MLLNIFLSIISATSIFVIFKYLPIFKVNVFGVVILNYLVAFLLGFTAPGDFPNILSLDFGFLVLLLTLGSLFIIAFNTIALSSEKSGISITTVASKMSVIIPIIFSIIYYSEVTNYIKVLGILISLLAVFFTVYSKKSKEINLKYIYFPIILFFLTGTIDLLLKFTQEKYVSEELAPQFTSMLFAVSLFLGLLVGLPQKKVRQSFKDYKIYVFGILLGLVNFGAIYFIIKALSGTLDGSIVFGINNISIVALSVLLGFFLFKEKLTKINWLGIILSLLAILLLTFNIEIISFL